MMFASCKTRVFPRTGVDDYFSGDSAKRFVSVEASTCARLTPDLGRSSRFVSITPTPLFQPL